MRTLLPIRAALISPLDCLRAADWQYYLARGDLLTHKYLGTFEVVQQALHCLQLLRVAHVEVQDDFPVNDLYIHGFDKFFHASTSDTAVRDAERRQHSVPYRSASWSDLS